MRDEDFEQIMAYHDKELDQEQSARVEKMLLENSEAREFIAQLQHSDEFLRDGLGDVLEQPVPQRLTDAARGKSAESPAGKKILAFPRRRPFSHWAYATAASVALAVLAGTYMLAGNPGPAQTDVLAKAVNEGLEATTSGDIYRVSDKPVQVMPMATFATRTAGICRQYAAQFEGEQSVGLACRQQGSQWQIRVQQTVSPGGQPQLYAPASGGEGQIAGEIEALGGGNPLGIEEEQTLISNEWQQ